MQDISAIQGSRRAASAGYAVIAMLAALAGAAAQAASQCIAAAARARAMAANRRHMHRMSDHTLRDIGLRRSQIDQLFR